MLQPPTAVLGLAPRLGEFPRPFGSLVLLKALSRDDRAEVYVALRPDGVDRLCVVSVLGPALTASPLVIDALRMQAAWLVGRVHGNLVQIYDVGESGGRLYFVSELVEGIDLGGLLAARQPKGLPAAVAVYMGLELVDALAYLRNTEERVTGVTTSFLGLAASSVMVSREGSVKLLHEGSCLAPSPGALVDRDIARASLIAPENAWGGSSVPGDVYLVGALLWQMLTGRPVGGGGSGARHIELLKAGLFLPQQLSGVGGSVQEVPEVLDELVLSCLAARSAERPADLEAVRSGLVAIMKGLGGAGRASTRRLLEEAMGRDLAFQAAELTRLSAVAQAMVAAGPPPERAVTLTSFEGRRRAPLSATSQLGIGKVIPGTRYRAIEKLGEGGMGVVYAAEHVDIEKKVALKLLHADLVRNPVVLRQFRQEARAASRIENPYICDVTDWGEVTDGRVFFVMEFIDGPSLGRVLKDSRRMTPARVIPIVRQVAKALASAHDKGIVHLDMKPDNVLLTERNGLADAVKVVDFGIAGLLGQGEGPSRVMGTPEYMAPERATGQGYDHRSDIYSLGVMAYEMLVGEVPFQADSAVETLAMHAHDPVDTINERLTRPVPASIEAVVMKMLAKDPARRPQSMVELEALLCEAQLEARIRTPWDDLPAPAVDAERAARITRRMSASARRTRKVVGGAAAVAFLGVLAAVYFAVRTPPGSAGAPASPLSVSKTHAPWPSSPGPAAPALQVARAAPPASPPATEGVTAKSVTHRRRTSVGDSADGVLAGADVARDPAKAQQAVAKGIEALSAGRLAQAAKGFAAAMAADRTNADAVGGMAEVSFEEARYSEAMDFARQATRLAPRSAKHLVILGDAYFKLGRFDEAVRAYVRAETLAPGDATIKSRREQASARLAKPEN